MDTRTCDRGNDQHRLQNLKVMTVLDLLATFPILDLGRGRAAGVTVRACDWCCTGLWRGPGPDRHGQWEQGPPQRGPGETEVWLAQPDVALEPAGQARPFPFSAASSEVKKKKAH